MYNSPGIQPSSTFHGVRRLLAYYHLPDMNISARVRTLEDAVEMLNDQSILILTPIMLAGDWYRTAAGPILVQSTDGVDQAILPDQLGRAYFWDEGLGRRVYLNEKNCGQFRPVAYAAALDFPHKQISPSALLGRLLSGLGLFEGILLLVWALLGSGLWVLMGQLLFRALSNGGLTAGPTALWQTGAMMGGVLLVEILLLVTGGQAVRRIAQRGTLAAMPGIGARLYESGQTEGAAETAVLLSSFRENGELWMTWLLHTVWGAVAAAVMVASLGRSLRAGAAAAGGIALVLYTASAALCRRAARGRQDLSADVSRRAWFLRRAVEQRLGVERPFPAKEYCDKPGTPVWVGWAAAALLTLPLLYFAVERGISLARLAQSLSLYLPVIALPLAALLDAGRAGRAFSALLALLPAAVRSKEEGVALPPMGSTLELRDVTFSYPDRTAPVLQGVNLRLHPGERVGILGATGSGKTTLARLMTGLLKPTGGNIYYGGVELARYNGTSLRRRIACERGSDIVLLEQMPDEAERRTCVVFSTREAALTGCDRIFLLADGQLMERVGAKTEN